jgi:hypothetical protein
MEKDRENNARADEKMLVFMLQHPHITLHNIIVIDTSLTGMYAVVVGEG